MDKRDKRILNKLGDPIINIGINEEVIKELRKDSIDDYNDLLLDLSKEHNTVITHTVEVRNKWIEEYTLSLCKITVGRIIGRVEDNDSVYKIDYEKLLKEGLEEQQSLRDNVINLRRWVIQ